VANSLLGYEGNDTISAGGEADRVYGHEGNDRLIGGAGVDYLEGGAGSDTMTGGAGVDTFYYRALTDSLPGDGNRDVITDFTHGEDKIDLDDIGGTTFIGSSSYSSIPGQVRAFFDGENTIVQMDPTGLKNTELEIVLKGQVTLTSDDFLF
jgi:Ca2+-binding RTX toxin-like protein